MKALFFLMLFFSLCYLSHGGLTPNDLESQFMFNKYYKADWMRRKNQINVTKYPKKIPTFVDDIYSCREPLGMSFFMLRGKVPPTRTRSNLMMANPLLLNRFYAHNDLEEYAYQPAYHDPNFYYFYMGYYSNYNPFVEIKLHGMTIVDGLLITGSNTPVDEINTRLTATWFVAPLRWSVNYTTTFKEWLPYRNKQGEIHQFSLLETTRKDGIAYPGYTKFDPRIIALAIRFIPIVCRVGANDGHALTIEVFGCNYDGAGLQTPAENEKRDYWFTKDNIMPWQLYTKHPSYLAATALIQPDLLLSKFYTGELANAMPNMFGYCQEKGKNAPVHFSLVQKGKYSFPNGSPWRYANRDATAYTTKCVHSTYRTRYSVFCFNTTKRYRESWDIPFTLKIKTHPPQDYKIWYNETTNELLTSLPVPSGNSSHFCAQRFQKVKFYFEPYPIKRTKDCDKVLKTFDENFCKNSFKKHLELDFKKIHLIDSLKFKGHSNIVRNSWASRVVILYSVDRVHWLPVKERYAENLYLETNKGPTHTSHHPLNPRIRARFLRIIPQKGKKDRCFRVEVRGCDKEPWLEVQQKVKDDAKRIGFNMWHVVVGEWNDNRIMKIKCFPDDAKPSNVTEKIYEVYGSYEFPLKLPENKLKLRKRNETKIYKCIARDKTDRVISTQFYIITSEKQRHSSKLLLPIQEQGLLHQGGMPILDHLGTVWAYEPTAAKITFLFFPDKVYSYEYYGSFDYWSTDYFYLKELGTATSIEHCFQLALHANEDYFLLHRKQCFTSWALPYWIQERVAEREKRYKYLAHVFYVNKGRKKYAVYWKKGGEKIGKLYVKATLPQDHVIYKLPRLGRGKFRFRFDSYITTHGYDSHSLVIHDFTANEVADYTISVVVGRQSLSRSVMLRHFGEPKFNMNATGGACLDHALTITAEPVRGEYVEVEEWNVEWRKIENGKALKTNMETQDPFVLKAKRATSSHSGVYRIRASNRYGFAEGVIHVNVVEHLPSITSVTSSPHVAVEDSSDVLYVDVENEAELESVDWYYNGKAIAIEDQHYSFPGALPGRPDTRKMLKMSNMHMAMSGVYKVVAKAKFCEFTKEITVDVYVRPKMIVLPNVRTLYQIAGGNTTVVKVIIAGGIPMPQEEHLIWYKDAKPLQATRYGRVRIQNDEWLEKKEEHMQEQIVKSKRKRIGWNSTLSIMLPRVSDSGRYSFMVSFPQTNYTVERILKVTKL